MNDSEHFNQPQRIPKKEKTKQGKKDQETKNK
jgi:hypothetical protein